MRVPRFNVSWTLLCQDFIFQVCLIYLDDIILFSGTTKQHLERIDIVLDRLQAVGLKLKPENCMFFSEIGLLFGSCQI